MKMHKLCEHLVKQTQKISAEKSQQNCELSISELKAIQRINKISSSLQSQSVQNTLGDQNTHVEQSPQVNQSLGCKLSALSDVELRNKIRSSDLDANENLFEYLISKNRRQLSIISPESLKRYVGLLE